MSVIDDTDRPRPAAQDGVVMAGPDFAKRRFRARLRRLRPYLLAAFVAAAVGGGVWLLYFSTVLQVNSVEVSGNAVLGIARIEKVAEVPVGDPLIGVDLAAIQARVERIDAVASAVVSRSWPSTILIQVTERVPIAVVRTDGREKALSSDGVSFERKASQLPADLPVIETAVDVDAATLGEAARVILALRQDVASRVDLVKAESMDNIVLKLSGGVTVEWGSAEDSENKAEVLAILLDKDVSRIDVSVPGRPTTR